MHAIKINKLELLDIVKNNKIKHVADVNESIEDYKTLVLQYSVANLKFAKSGNMEEFKKIKPLPSAPLTYESSYTRAIRMLELSVDDTIEVEEDVFNQLVLDEWSWKRSFITSNASYKVGGAL